jgi:L-ascorbate metabolism protein UlaG (beta-lactamase superfamily)
MKKIPAYRWIHFLLVVLLILIVQIAVAQNKKIEITFLGNCGLFMTDGEINVYVDFPYKSGAYGYMTYEPELLDNILPNSIFLFTHGHADHFSRKLFKRTHQKLYGPWPVKIYMNQKRKYKLEELNDSLPGFVITKFKTRHGFSFKHYSYLIEWHGKRIFISGDTHLADTLVSIKNLDMVFAAPWVLTNAWERKLKIDAKQIILYHHRSVESINNKSDKIIVPEQNERFKL